MILSSISLLCKVFHLGAVCFGAIILLEGYQMIYGQHREDGIDLKKVAELLPLYATFWGMALQYMYFSSRLVLYTLEVFTSTRSMRESATNALDFILTTIITPSAFTVTLIFWSLWCLDPKLIMRDPMEKLAKENPFVNHSIHTANSILALLDLLLTNHKYPGWGPTVAAGALFTASYSACLFGTYLEREIWLYPFFDNLCWPLRLATTLGIGFILITFSGLSRLITRLLWGESCSMLDIAKKHSSLP